MDATRFLESLKRARLDLYAARIYVTGDANLAKLVEGAHATLLTLIETVQEEQLAAKYGDPLAQHNAETMARFDRFIADAVEPVEHVRAAR